MNSRLPDAAWRNRPGLPLLLATLGAEQGETRYVGGAVRDTLLGIDVYDIDMATIHSPEQVMERLQQAGIKAVPTGIAHGTITAVVDSHPYEITTLRSDVSTNGRHAEVAFTDDWQQDASRRDFTINALYAHAHSGEITDFFGGLDDLRNRHVRFIGHAEDRIAEDHLRIMRYFRFFARYGSGAPDTDAYAACIAQANSLMALSRERIADELLKLLSLPDPVQAIALMVDGGIFRPVLPEIDRSGLDRLRTLIQREAEIGWTPAPLLRLCALLPADVETANIVSARLKLSNKARKRIEAALTPAPTCRSVYELAFRLGVQAAQDIILLDAGRSPSDALLLQGWAVPQLTIGGAALMELGLAPGPMIAKALGEIREQWLAEDFPGPDRVREIAAQTVSLFQRASK